MNKLLQKLTYGHYILTALKPADELETRKKDYMAAGTVNWATQVSFDPEIIAIAVGQKSDLNETINYSGKFTLHLLGMNNREMISSFGTKSEIKDGKINGHGFSKVDDQVILDDTSGYLICEVQDHKHIGDHFVYFGKVITGVLNEAGEDLLCSKDVATQYNEEIAAV